MNLRSPEKVSEGRPDNLPAQSLASLLEELLSEAMRKLSPQVLAQSASKNSQANRVLEEVLVPGEHLEQVGRDRA